MEVCCSNRHAFDHDFQNISVSAEVRRSIFQILYCVGLDKSGVLHPTVVIDIVLFEKVRLGLNTDSVCFHLLIAVSIPVNFYSLLVSTKILPFLIEILQHFHWSGFVVSHYNSSIQILLLWTQIQQKNKKNANYTRKQVISACGNVFEYVCYILTVGVI